jgi:hypothetical protein
MAWMTVEAAAGIVASSIVLIGFGLDSVIEFFAAAVVLWQLRGTVSEERESRALRLIGGTFFALAAYLAIESVTDLVSQHRPEQSTARDCGHGGGAGGDAAAGAGQAPHRPDATGLWSRTRPKARSVPSPPPPHWLASGSTAGSDGGGPTRRQLLSSRAWRSGRVSKPGRKTTTDRGSGLPGDQAGGHPARCTKPRRSLHGLWGRRRVAGQASRDREQVERAEQGSGPPLAATGPSATPTLPGQEHLSHPDQSPASLGERGGPAWTEWISGRPSPARVLPVPAGAGP